MIKKKKKKKKRKEKDLEKRCPYTLTYRHARKGNLWIIMHVTVGMSGFWFQRV